VIYGAPHHVFCLPRLSLPAGIHQLVSAAADAGLEKKRKLHHSQVYAKSLFRRFLLIPCFLNTRTDRGIFFFWQEKRTAC
jgi:hypothetical protein